ncbi:anaerobic selenocysteine-containing dehydrogenase [Williamsia limnetica]|uniref:Anaerobic selenocysteine-containing dehydrogenase n=1 Tax=Williamsia limnetica TaxID=882452 RepID=A0A318RQ09_WILLI|nr:molybdopterin-dependent oxidoreductase [Williamsia limnetica]PYE19176.1 anaerobic selenocysteine-containing dehydrogenase [Williamsia limnetica]
MTPITTRSVCNLCEAICGLQVTVDAGKVTDIRGDRDDPLSRGHICPKATALTDLHLDPDRLRTPLRKTADGGWEDISWKAAATLVADKIVSTQEKYGRDGVAVYTGNPNVHSLGFVTHGVPFLGALGTRNMFSATSADQLPIQLTAHLMYGHQLQIPIPDLDHTDHLLIIGANPVVSNGSMMTAPDFRNRMRELRRRGGRLVVIDPRRTETAAIADEHHYVRPGTDAALLLAVLHVLVHEAGVDDKRIAHLPLAGLDELEAACRSTTPEWAAPLTGVDAEDIRSIATDFAAAERAVAYGRMGVSTQQFGTLCQWAIQAINAVTGNLDRVGGALLTDPEIDLVARKLSGRGHFDKWRSRVRDLPEFGGELPVSTLADEISTPGERQIKTLITVAGNPVSSSPGGSGLDEALAGLDFMVSIDFYVNETTRHADLILPPTMIFERDHYDLIFHQLAVHNSARFSPAVVEKSAGAKHDWEIFRDLTSAIARRRATSHGRGINALRRRAAGMPAQVKSRARSRATPRTLLALLLRTGPGKLTLSALLRSPSGVDLGPLRPGLRGKLVAKSGAVQLAPPLLLADLDRLHTDLVSIADGQLLLIGRRHLRSNNSWMNNSPRLSKGQARHHLLMHPKDLAGCGLSTGDRAVLRSRAGSVTVTVAETDDIMPGVVSLPHGFGQRRSGVRLAVAGQVDAPSANDVTDPMHLDTVSGNAVLNGVPVTVSPS